MNARRTFAALIALCAAACGGPRYEARPAPSLSTAITDRGDLVYVGRVFPLDTPAAEPTYVYERRVDERDGAMVSTHVTRDRAGAIQLAEAATHSNDYALADYTLYANQLGQSGSIAVDGDTVTFTLDGDEGERTETEHTTEPVAVGPTLVGFIVRHLDAIERGETVPVRLAVIDRLETIGFELEAAESAPGQMRVQMNASSFIYRLAIDPVFFTFERSTQKLVRLEGRVPTKVRRGDHWSDFDARVEYAFVAPSYR